MNPGWVPPSEDYSHAMLRCVQRARRANRIGLALACGTVACHETVC